MAADVQPLDPDSPKGRQVAADLNQLAEIFVELDAKRAVARPSRRMIK